MGPQDPLQGVSRLTVKTHDQLPKAGITVLPFHDLRILDLTHVLAGPYATYQFALLGADVVKVENPGNPDCARGRGPSAALAKEGLGLNYQVQAANKRAIALDLKQDAGRRVLLRLADFADVLVENYSPGAMEALGLGAGQLTRRNPRLVYCSINGFGGVGGQAANNAYDNVMQAASGMMAATGGAGAPVKTAASVVDYFTGMSAAFAISAALHERARTGRGGHVECAMFDCALALMAPEISAHLYSGPRRELPREAGLGTYDTADGKLVLGAFTPDQYRLLWRTLDDAEYADLRDWEDVWSNSDAMRARLAPIFAREPAVHWEALLNGVGIPAQRVRTLDETLKDASLARPQYLKRLVSGAEEDEVTLPLAPYRVGEAGPQITGAPPRVGEHSDEILRETGFSNADIAALRASGAVA